jgi:hypothetical protein
MTTVKKTTVLGKEDLVSLRCNGTPEPPAESLGENTATAAGKATAADKKETAPLAKGKILTVKLKVYSQF